MAADIETQGWSYPQTALTFTVTHTRPHQDISTEFHTEHGPFTTVPLPGLRSSIVCVVGPADAERLRRLSGSDLDAEVERRSHSILGKTSVEPGRGAFPLGAETAKVFAARRVALVGEAAHRIPPIGAQGLNLGLRDAATIGELVVAAKRAGGDIGADDVLNEYDRLRRADVTSRTFSTEGMISWISSASRISASVAKPNAVPRSSACPTARSTSGCAWPSSSGPHAPT